jgi:hypothetical protein
MTPEGPLDHIVGGVIGALVQFCLGQNAIRSGAWEAKSAIGRKAVYRPSDVTKM